MKELLNEKEYPEFVDSLCELVVGNVANLSKKKYGSMIMENFFELGIIYTIQLEVMDVFIPPYTPLIDV